MDEAPETTTEELTATGFQILRINKGDTVVVRADATNAQQIAFINQAMMTLFAAHGLTPGEVHLLIIPANLDVAVLDEASMKRQGWERRGLIAMPGQNGVRH